MSLLKDGMSVLAQHDDPEYWIEQAIMNMGPSELKQAVETNENIITNFFNTKYLNFPGIRKRSRAILNKNWDKIEYLLLTPENTMNLLEQVEGNLEIIGTDEGIEYVNNMCINAYFWIREFVYQEQKNLLEALQEEPNMPLKTFREIAQCFNIGEDAFKHILNNFEQTGKIDIYIVLNKPHRKES